MTCLHLHPTPVHLRGGRLVQIAMWKMVGYRKSMVVATRVGLVGAVLVALYGLAVGPAMLIFIGAFGFYACYQRGQMLRYGEEEEEPQYDVGYYNEQEESEGRDGSLTRWRTQRQEIRQRREAEKNASAEQDLDRILAKIKDRGMESLTGKEKKILQRATKQRQRND